MEQQYNNIMRELHSAASTGDTGAYLAFLDSVLLELRNTIKTAKHTAFGAQFKPGDQMSAEDQGAAVRAFEPDQKVRTDDGYIGHVAHYDRRGRVVVNVVFQACEYSEKQLAAMEKSS